jgi:hypothetical protein
LTSFALTIEIRPYRPGDPSKLVIDPPLRGISVRSDDRGGTLQLVSNQGAKAAALMGRRLWAGVVAAAVVTAAVAACGTDAADQKVIDRLSKLNLMTVPPGATEVSRTSHKGGGNSVIRNTSSVTLVYATTQSPFEVKDDIHARFDSKWHFHDNGAVVLGGWRASGSPGTEPGTYPDTVVDVVARRVTSADKAPAGSQSVVTVEASATRPA